MNAASDNTDRLLLRQIERKWQQINATELNGQLNPPVFALDRAKKRLGQWHAETRTISLSFDHLVRDTWLDVELTLRHEMAHQIVSELFSAEHAQPHGRLFQRACKLLKIDDSPRGNPSIDPEGQRILRRVQKLMTLAAATSQEEAQAAITVANKLLLKHNLTASNSETHSEYSYRWLGVPTGRVTLEHKLISRILQDFFFVQCLWVGTSVPASAKRVRILEIMGQSHNLELAHYVYDFLTRAVNELWRSYKKNQGKVSLSIRNDYRSGVLMGFSEHLESQQKNHREEGLIWLGDPALDDYLGSRYPRTQSMRRSYYRNGQAHNDGKSHGRKLRLRPGVDKHGSNTTPSGLLTKGRQ